MSFAQMQKGEKMKHEVIISQTLNDFGITIDVKAIPLIRCKDCKHFEYDHPYIIQGVPVLGHLVCTKWGDGCRTDENGFCFMAERKEGAE